MSCEKNLHWLVSRLPPVEVIPLGGEPDFYGASSLIATLAGESAPIPCRVGGWTHGWPHVRPIIHPKQLVEYGDADDVCLVFTKEHVRILRNFGYVHVHAVGAPYIYADSRHVKRLEGSLLVMPAHSLPYTAHAWRMDEYAREIDAIRDRFSCVVACVSASCVKHGYWTQAFGRLGIPWITGAQIDDKNALRRMSTIFNSFEFMTTHTIGSHVAYAAYSGCRVSLYGQYVAFNESDAKGIPLYEKYPQILKANVQGTSETVVKARFGDFFTRPDKAPEMTAWGREQLGANCKRSPRKVAKLLMGWPASGGYNDRLKARLGAVLRKIKG